MKLISSKEELRGRTNSALGMRKQKITKLSQVTGISEDVHENMFLLEECRRYWDSLRDFRQRRLRSRKYYRGEQWDDTIINPDNESELITEKQYLLNQGKVPLKQNLISNNVRNLVGQYLSNPSKTIVFSRIRDNAQATEMMTNALHSALQVNNIKLLDVTSFKESALSGAPIQKVGYEFWRERDVEDVFINNVSSARIFFNTDVADARLFDLRLIGEIIDAPVDKIVSIFARSKADEKKIREIYAGLVDREYLTDIGLSPRNLDNMDFFNPRDTKSGRLFEIWQLKGAWKTYAHDPMDGSSSFVDFSLEDIAAQNAERIRIAAEEGISEEEVPLIEAEERYELTWFVKFLTPFGHCLYEGETPYKHQSHPYILSLMPMIDGEVWGIIEDMIDQQRYINRLIIQLDSIIGASAKGVLMVPDDVVPDNMSPEQFAKEYVRFNGVIFYKPQNHMQIPQQISSNSTNVGIHEMLALQMQLFQDVSGIHGAIQGKEANAGTPASMYAMQSQNATINTMEQMVYFENFLQERDKKVLKVILQYYNDRRYLSINGKSISEESRMYDPELVKNMDFDVVVTQGKDTPVYRQLIDDTLKELLMGGMIDLKMFLENSSLPFADKLIEAINSREQLMKEGQAPGAMPQDLVNQVTDSANPKAMAMLNQVIGNKVPQSAQ